MKLEQPNFDSKNLGVVSNIPSYQKNFRVNMERNNRGGPYMAPPGAHKLAQTVGAGRVKRRQSFAHTLRICALLCLQFDP